MHNKDNDGNNNNDNDNDNDNVAPSCCCFLVTVSDDPTRNSLTCCGLSKQNLQTLTQN